jgi:hypothetical protein
MPKKITANAREELVAALRDQFLRATRSEKTLILNEFVAVSGYPPEARNSRPKRSRAAQRTSRARSSRPRLHEEAVRQR